MHAQCLHWRTDVVDNASLTVAPCPALSTGRSSRRPSSQRVSLRAPEETTKAASESP